ncbi:hypothetical protein ACLB2K_019627 [Fragaria x ananassa]
MPLDLALQPPTATNFSLNSPLSPQPPPKTTCPSRDVVSHSNAPWSTALIGVVGLPVEIKHLPSGKVLAWTRLAVKKSATDTSWINLTFWDDLAHVAFQHLEKGNQIYVSGGLISDAFETSEGKQETYYKVVVQQLNFVGKSSPSVNGQDSDSFTPGRSSSHSFTKHTETTQELWQAFFANPGEWWDNRKTKRNSKYPDFKHKDTGEALWIEGRNNPPWVKSQLAILDTRMGTANDQDNTTHSNLFTDDNFFKCWKS